MLTGKMTSIEKRAVCGLSSIMGLRMVGLFMVLPVLALYVSQLRNASPFLTGLAMGIYGLSQAIFQIPFGTLSDRFGRKPIILIGLLIFALGSLIAGLADSITAMLIGRTLQGAGAVGSTILAMIADLTREEQRTKSMAIAGITIGLSFSVAMLLGPLLTKWLSIPYLFFLAMILSGVAIFILYAIVPTPLSHSWHRDTEPERSAFLNLLINPQLAKLNSGIFILHAIFTASFVAIPIQLAQRFALAAAQQWKLYLPTLLMAFLISLFCISLAERKHQLKPYFLGGISTLFLSELLLSTAQSHVFLMAIGVGGFFTSFSLLEAFLPSLVSRTAPIARKGTALGIFSCAQFLGIFVGGLCGGWLYGTFSFLGIYVFCMTLAFIWLILAFFMQPPRYFLTQLLPLSRTRQIDLETIAAQLQSIPGMVEVTIVAEDRMAYLKMERKTITHPDFIRLKEQLQSE